MVQGNGVAMRTDVQSKFCNVSSRIAYNDAWESQNGVISAGGPSAA
jgi:hypothetical protein